MATVKRKPSGGWIAARRRFQGLALSVCAPNGTHTGGKERTATAATPCYRRFPRTRGSSGGGRGFRTGALHLERGRAGHSQGSGCRISIPAMPAISVPELFAYANRQSGPGYVMSGLRHLTLTSCHPEVPMPDALPEVFCPPSCRVADPPPTASLCLKPSTAFVPEHCGLPDPTSNRHNPPGLWPTASPCFARVWAYPTTPARWGQRDYTVLYGFCAWPPNRIAQGTVQMTNPPRQWQAAFPAVLPGNRHHRPRREGGRKRPANPPNAWQLLLYLSRARWGVRGCTDLALASRQFARRMLPIGPPHSTDRIRVLRRAGRDRRPNSPVENGRMQAPGRVRLPQDESDVCRKRDHRGE